MLSCRDVTGRASLYLDRELSLRSRLGLRLHLLLCRNCRDFMRNFEHSIAITRQLAAVSADVAPAFLERINTTLRARLEQDSTTESAADSSAPRPRLRLVQGSGSDPRVERVFREIEAAQGSVANLFRAYAHNPEVLEANWNRVRAVMLQGSLSRKLKEAIAVVVSSDNGCRYCVEHHSRALHIMGVAPEEIERFLRDPLAGNFEPGERALLALARQANRDPHGASDRQIEVARLAGMTDGQIIEALAVMELFVSFNRFLDTLDIPLEPAFDIPLRLS